MQEAATNQAKQIQYQCDLIAEQLGFSNRCRRCGPDHQDGQGPMDPYIGSYVGKEIDLDLDSLAAYAYHRSCFYAETHKRISNQWTELDQTVTETYLQCQKTALNWIHDSATFQWP
ncbi:hypothetical protein VP01_234g3 [Puccinia sorghi]|uniref:Uncharacterized protein n=1 Tax=Puccinia sorghi TaxID=27349 RepID=A0A0L6V801_9BASI|nr:hypothetical protein VP01_234g3 [Puccinia sorghi]